MKPTLLCSSILLAATLGTSSARSEYADMLGELKTKITRALPVLNETKKAAYQDACQAEAAAAAALAEATKREGEIETARALVQHAKGKWIGGADKGIAAAKEKLRKAADDAGRRKAREELAHWEANRKEGLAALAERQAALEKARADAPAAGMDRKHAAEALALAETRTNAAVLDLGLSDFLSSDAFDVPLARHLVLMESTPKALAAFAGRGDAERRLIDGMLGDGNLLVQMAVADGAKDGNYGRAMEIYREIRESSDRASQGCLQRLALAIALEHAVPVKQRNAVADTTAPAVVDPVKRYGSYERAFLIGDLDPAFDRLSVWDYRMVVDGEEPDEISAWGREMLRNYRPDQITNPDYRWRYVDAVRTDIRYGSQDVPYDRDDLQFFQNILMNGGICGRRAFYGRFILRAFGIPTTARPQPGHGALVHWTPDGWVPCLGAGWGSGWTKTRYGRDVDFLATTQARVTGPAFLPVKRAQWIGDALGERRVFGLLSGKPGFWYGVSLHLQRSVIEAARSKALDAVGQDIAEANETKEEVKVAKVSITPADREVRIDSRGVITIPAAATRQPASGTRKILFMDSALGGKQLHYSRNGGHQDFEYTIDVPTAGTYALTARVVTPSWKQSILLRVNDAAKPVEIPLPFTVGMWEETSPLEIELAKGTNILRFSRSGDVKGVTIREFILKPTGGA